MDNISHTSELSRREFLATAAERTAILGGVAAVAGGRTFAADEPTYPPEGVAGTAWLKLGVPPARQLKRPVKFRFKVHVDKNECTPTPTHPAWKIIFMYIFLRNPEDLSKKYGLQFMLHSNRAVFANETRLEGGRPLGGVPEAKEISAETGMKFRVEDTYRDKKVGLKSRNVEKLPVLNLEIDGIKDYWERAAYIQEDMTGKTVSIEVARSDLAKDLRGWSTHGDMPPGNYRIWTITASWDGQSQSVDCIAPEEHAKYLGTLSPANIATEAFRRHRGLLRVYYWDFEMQDEDSTDWLSVFGGFVSTNGDPSDMTWGMKKATFQGKPVIEVSNDGTKTYLINEQRFRLMNPPAQ